LGHRLAAFEPVAPINCTASTPGKSRIGMALIIWYRALRNTNDHAIVQNVIEIASRQDAKAWSISS
jgi:hypothetical protein